MPAFEQAEGIAMPTQGGDPFGSAVVSIVLSVVMLMILWIPAACLYPVTFAAGMTAGLVTRAMFIPILPANAGDVAFALGAAVAAIVFGIVIRIEARLSRFPRYRLARHVVRMVLLAIWAIPIIQLATGTTAPGTSTAYIFAVVSSPRAIAQFLINPLHLGLWLAVVVGLHFLIWKSERARRLWHRRLSWVGLK